MDFQYCSGAQSETARWEDSGGKSETAGYRGQAFGRYTGTTPIYALLVVGRYIHIHTFFHAHRSDHSIHMSVMCTYITVSFIEIPNFVFRI